MLQINEEWKDIDLSLIGESDYTGLYQISSFGNVKSFKDKKNTIILKPRIMTKGYFFITLVKNKIKKQFSNHFLVAYHFVRPPMKGEEVNHKDLNKLNNFYLNLEWTTHVGNMKHFWANRRKYHE